MLGTRQQPTTSRQPTISSLPLLPCHPRHRLPFGASSCLLPDFACASRLPGGVTPAPQARSRTPKAPWPAVSTSASSTKMSPFRRMSLPRAVPFMRKHSLRTRPTICAALFPQSRFSNLRRVRPTALLSSGTRTSVQIAAGFKSSALENLARRHKSPPNSATKAIPVSAKRRAHRSKLEHGEMASTHLLPEKPDTIRLVGWPTVVVMPPRMVRRQVASAPVRASCQTDRDILHGYRHQQAPLRPHCSHEPRQRRSKVPSMRRAGQRRPAVARQDEFAAIPSTLVFCKAPAEQQATPGHRDYRRGWPVKPENASSAGTSPETTQSHSGPTEATISCRNLPQ